MKRASVVQPQKKKRQKVVWKPLKKNSLAGKRAPVNLLMTGILGNVENDKVQWIRRGGPRESRLTRHGGASEADCSFKVQPVDTAAVIMWVSSGLWERRLPRTRSIKSLVLAPDQQLHSTGNSFEIYRCTLERSEIFQSADRERHRDRASWESMVNQS